MRNWSAKIIEHGGSKRIAVYFEKNAKLIARIKRLPGAKWSQTLQVWHLPDHTANRIRFNLPQKDNGLNPDKKEVLTDFRHYLITKRYSENTIKTYTEF